MARCSLCGGRLDFEKRCILCGLDNTKNDKQYEKMLNKNDCAEEPLTHVHEDVAHSQGKMQRAEYATPTYTQQRVGKSKATSIYTQQRVGKSNTTQSKMAKKGVGSLVAIIIAIFGIIPSLIGLIEETSYEPDIREYEYENYLESGMYEVGVHIPEGTYAMELNWGEDGLVEIMEFEEKGFLSVDSYDFGIGAMEYVEGIYLSEGQILLIPSDMNISLYSDDVHFYEVSGVENYLSESFVITGEAIAGNNFPAGVYDIWYELMEDTEEEEYGDVSYRLVNPENGEVVFEDSQYFASDMGTTVYRNVYFSEGSKIWLNGLKEVVLTPSEVIGVSE